MAETVTVRNMRLVNPTGTSLSSGDFQLNDRLDTLSGKTLGLLENSKANSDKVFAPEHGGIPSASLDDP